MSLRAASCGFFKPHLAKVRVVIGSPRLTRRRTLFHAGCRSPDVSQYRLSALNAADFLSLAQPNFVARLRQAPVPVSDFSAPSHARCIGVVPAFKYRCVIARSLGRASNQGCKTMPHLNRLSSNTTVNRTPNKRRALFSNACARRRLPSR